MKKLLYLVYLEPNDTENERVVIATTRSVLKATLERMIHTGIVRYGHVEKVSEQLRMFRKDFDSVLREGLNANLEGCRVETKMEGE